MKEMIMGRNAKYMHIFIHILCMHTIFVVCVFGSILPVNTKLFLRLLFLLSQIIFQLVSSVQNINNSTSGSVGMVMSGRKYKATGIYNAKHSGVER